MGYKKAYPKFRPKFRPNVVIAPHFTEKGQFEIYFDLELGLNRLGLQKGLS